MGYMALRGNIISINIEILFGRVKGIAKRSKQQRLYLSLSQKTLSDRSDVKYGTLKKFEQTGQISLESLLKIALVLGRFDDFDDLFVENVEKSSISFEKLFEENTRKRGRK